jgi:tRNA nucleotidyltransferase/poly(A) polymerase
MPDYIYLLENRLSADQRHALQTLREAAREAEMILFLTGDAVRDLTSGHAVRDMEVAVQGNALKLKKPLEKAGAKIWGEDDASRTLFLCFPGTVRVDVVSTHSVDYKKPGQPAYHWSSIHEDLRRRDFTVNAMALSLNEGSFGLLMDPLNGVADIEARAIRLVSNYGFIEDPSLMIRATRYRARLGWELDPRTQQRYENARGEDLIQYMTATAKARELEQIGHEDEGLKILHALDADGWMKVLCPAWTPAKADEDRLRALHDLSVELLMQGVHADISAAQMQLLTAKMPPKDLAVLKKSLLRHGFVDEWNNLDAIAAGFQKLLLAKENQAPSAMYKLFTTYDPEAVLWLGFTSKESAVKDRYNRFLHVWPEMRQKVPYALMQEMRIRPELANYNEIVHAVFLQLIDGKLETPEEMRAFLEPYSPPAPPPQVTIKRSRGKRAEKVKVLDEDEESESSGSDEDLDDMGGEDEDIGIGSIDLTDEDGEAEEVEEADEDEEGEDGEEHVKAKAGRKTGRPAKPAAAPAPASAKKAVAPAAKPPAKPTKAPAHAAPAKAPAHHAPAKATAHHAPAKAAAHHPAPAKHAPASPAKHAPAKHAPAPAKHAVAPARHVAAPAKHAAAPAKHAAAPAKHAPAKTAKHAPAKAHDKAHEKKHPAPKTPVKKATLKPSAKPAHKSVPKAPEKKTTASKPANGRVSTANSAKPAAKAKPHHSAKPAPHKAPKPGAKRK